MSDFEDLDDLLDTATPASQDVNLCLDGGRQVERDALMKAALQAEDGGERLGAKSSATKARQALAKLDAELRDRLLTIRVFALEGTEWAALKAKHKPRDGNAQDRAQGFNIEAVSRAALLRAGKRVVGDSLRDVTPGQWEKLFKKISGGDFETLIYATFGVNQLGSQAMTAALVKGSPATSNSAGK